MLLPVIRAPPSQARGITSCMTKSWHSYRSTRIRMSLCRPPSVVSVDVDVGARVFDENMEVLDGNLEFADL